MSRTTTANWADNVEEELLAAQLNMLKAKVANMEQQLLAGGGGGGGVPPPRKPKQQPSEGAAVGGEVAPPAPNKMKQCSFFQAGSCTHGDNCRFAHNVVVPSVGAVGEVAPPATKPNSGDAAAKKTFMGKNSNRQVCKFFERGDCKNGSNCSFLHPASCSGSSSGDVPRTPSFTA